MEVGRVEVALAANAPPGGNITLRPAETRTLYFITAVLTSLGEESFSAMYDGTGAASIQGGDRMGVVFGAGAFLRPPAPMASEPRLEISPLLWLARPKHACSM